MRMAFPAMSVCFSSSGTGERFPDVLLRVRPCGVGVWIARGPHHVADTDFVADSYRGGVLDKGVEDLAVDVEARLFGERRLAPEPMLTEHDIGALLEVRQP